MLDYWYLAVEEENVKEQHELWLNGIKPKFHYADFPVTSATSPRQTRDVPFSPNSITPMLTAYSGQWPDVSELTITNRHEGSQYLPAEIINHICAE